MPFLVFFWYYVHRRFGFCKPCTKFIIIVIIRVLEKSKQSYTAASFVVAVGLVIGIDAL